MSINSNLKPNPVASSSALPNPQLLQQRLSVREHEINALKVQNRHLLGKIEQLEQKAVPNQINTQFIAQETQKYLEPIVKQLQSTMTASFEILQSTMRGIYQQSARAQQAVEDMAAQSRDLENRMNEQRKADQNFYQDKILAMVTGFGDRMERQIDHRLKSLSVVEILSSKQNEVLSDVEAIKSSLSLMQKSAESSRSEMIRIERNGSEANEKLSEMQMQTQQAEELVRDTFQQIQNHRTEFKLIRAEIKTSLDYVNKMVNLMESQSSEVRVAMTAATESAADAAANAMSAAGAADAAAKIAATPPPAPVVRYYQAPQTSQDSGHENRIIQNMIETKQRELQDLERDIESQGDEDAQDDATVILSLLRAQKTELQRVASEAKAYLKGQAKNPQEPVIDEVVDAGPDLQI